MVGKGGILAYRGEFERCVVVLLRAWVFLGYIHVKRHMNREADLSISNFVGKRFGR